MKIVIGNDHAGVDMKKHIMTYLQEKGIEVVNVGSDVYESVDYPVYGEKVANAVKNKEADLGIAICGTGNGMNLVCNKVTGIRSVVCSEPFTASFARRHNNCNVLCFGARVIGESMAEMIVDAFLEGTFEGGKHQRRVDMVMDVETRNKGIQ